MDQFDFISIVLLLCLFAFLLYIITYCIQLCCLSSPIHIPPYSTRILLLNWETLCLYNTHINPQPYQCCICLESFPEQQKVSYFKNCGTLPHQYCHQCILNYGKTLILDNPETIIHCPICRKPIWTGLHNS